MASLMEPWWQAQKFPPSFASSEARHDPCMPLGEEPRVAFAQVGSRYVCSHLYFSASYTQH